MEAKAREAMERTDSQKREVAQMLAKAQEVGWCFEKNPANLLQFRVCEFMQRWCSPFLLDYYCLALQAEIHTLVATD